MHSERADLRQAARIPTDRDLYPSYILNPAYVCDQSPLAIGISGFKVPLASRTSPKCNHEVLDPLLKFPENVIDTQ